MLRAMEPDRQVEIQLGHMCNNRCVFCVSGQRTAMGEAFPLEVEPILARIREAHARGHRKITLLGGEPTLQPGFMDVVRECVALGFEDIVLFTNGVKTARPAFIDQIRATGGKFTWRISIQGATEEAHERTTRKPGSFARIVRTLETLRDRGERITVNMCVVRSNYESVVDFPELLAQYGAVQLHLDMVRPMDAGVRSEDELREMIPRYSDMVPALTRMAAGFEGTAIDVNVGNVPYCIAPSLAQIIHHDGQYTDTIAIDGDDRLSRPWNKYFVKRRDKLKRESCRRCVFDGSCSGVFEAYAHFYGTDELTPVDREALVQIDPKRRFLALHLRDLLPHLPDWTAEERGLEELALTHVSREGQSLSRRVRVVLRQPDAGGSVARYGRFSVHVELAGDDVEESSDALTALHEAFVAAGERVIHPLGSDALDATAPSVASRLARLRASAPFGELVWSRVATSDDGSRAELELIGPDGERATVWLSEEAERARGGYTLDGDAPTPAQVEGIGSLMNALRGASARV